MEIFELVTITQKIEQNYQELLLFLITPNPDKQHELGWEQAKFEACLIELKSLQFRRNQIIKEHFKTLEVCSTT